MTKNKALKMALKFIKSGMPIDTYGIDEEQLQTTIKAIRQALNQLPDTTKMIDKDFALNVALEALHNFADDESVDGRKAIDAIGVVRKALAEPDTGKDEETTRDEYTKAIEDALNYGHGFVKVQHVEPSNTEVEYWRKKAEHLEQENFAWRTKLAVRGYEIEIESLRQALAELRNSTTDVVEPVAYVHLEEWVDNKLWPEDAFSITPFEGMTPLYAAPPKTNTEPVAWVKNLTDPQPHCVTDLAYRSAADALNNVGYIPLYTAPPKREWRGLTGSELLEMFRNDPGCFGYGRAIEAKLKERNT